MEYKVDDKVIISLGKGIITRVDDKTYSITMYNVELVGGRFDGEIIVKCESEIMIDN